MLNIINLVIIVGLLIYGLVLSQPLWGVVAGLFAIASATGDVHGSRRGN
jgi:hypothetical protein